MTSTLPDTGTINQHEAEQLERANESGLTPVAFVHGLWLLPSSWDRWAAAFEAADSWRSALAGYSVRRATQNPWSWERRTRPVHTALSAWSRTTPASSKRSSQPTS